jgi:transposase
MSERFAIVDRETPLLFPGSVQEALSEGHLARFIVDAGEELDMNSFKVNKRGSGSEQYPPRMMLSLLIYCSSVGIFSSRQIERAMYEVIPEMYICGIRVHPAHTRIAAFRKEHREAFEEAFRKVLLMARCAKQMKGIRQFPHLPL